MSLKKKLGMGIASAALGLSLIGGGTYAYFSDTAQASAKFANGTLDLNAVPTTIIDVKNLKPGDWMDRTFKLKNDGTLDIGKILLTTDYTVTDANNNNGGEDLGKYIRVNFLTNVDKGNTVIWSTTLDNLKKMSPDVIENKLWNPWFEERGGKLAAGTDDTLVVQFKFDDNGQDQNKFQGDSLQLNWTFDGRQTSGESR